MNEDVIRKVLKKARGFKCEFCNKRFDSKLERLFHEQLHEQEQTTKEKEGNL